MSGFALISLQAPLLHQLARDSLLTWYLSLLLRYHPSVSRAARFVLAILLSNTNTSVRIIDRFNAKPNS